MKNKKTEKENKRGSNVLIILISFLFMASIAMIVAGLLDGKKENGNKGGTDLTEVSREKQDDLEEGLLTDLFQKEFAEQSESAHGYLNDPFREICAPVRGDAPAMPSFTICQP